MTKTGPSVLIIDDNADFINRMCGLLKDVGIQLITRAHNYPQALLQLAARETDVVLLDINLPGKNGVEILRAIRDLGYRCEVIMLSNFTNPYYRHICRDLGVTHFLDKSSDFGLVSGIINKLNPDSAFH